MSGERYTAGLRGTGMRIGKRIRQGAAELTDAKNLGGGLVASFVSGYQEHFLDICDARARSTYYNFVLGDKENQDGIYDYLEVDVLRTFYPTTLRAANEFVTARDSIFTVGKSLIEKDDKTVEDYGDASKTILDDCYDLVRTLGIMNSAKPKQSIVASQMSGPVKIGIQKFLDSIGNEKPEAFRETLRRDMPRFLWHPLPFPENIIPDERDEQLRQLWSSYTSLDANNLIHQDQLQAGNAPLHMALNTAQTVEKDGDFDLGYVIKTSSILRLLDMERERSQQSPFPEFPLFTYVLGGVMSGDIKNPPKNAHFNYQSALHETIMQTGSRLTDELNNGEEGPATVFIQKLLQYYPDNLPQLLAHSFGNLNGIYNGIDVLKLMQGLTTIDKPWAAQLRKGIFELPQRRILTNAELIQLSEYLPAHEPTLQETQMHENIKKIIGEEDIYSFKKRLREGNGTDIDLTVELDNVTKDIDIKFVSRNGTTVRYIPFHIDFSSGTEVFSSVVMENETLPRPIIYGYIDLVAKTIQDRADEIRARETKPSGSQISVYQREPTHDKLNTDKSDHTLRRTRPKVKTRPVEPVEQKTTPIDEPETELLPQAEGKFTLGGLDIPTITSFLEVDGVEAVTPERILAKISHHLEMANAKNWPPGKHLGLEKLDKKATGLDIRQINWALDGNAIRILLFGTGNRHYEICGIMNKKSSNQQNAYLRNLIKRLNVGKIRP